MGKEKLSRLKRFNIFGNGFVNNENGKLCLFAEVEQLPAVPHAGREQEDSQQRRPGRQPVYRIGGNQQGDRPEQHQFSPAEGLVLPPLHEPSGKPGRSLKAIAELM